MNLRLALPVLVLLVSACASDPDKLPPSNPITKDSRAAQIRELRLQAGQLYKAARESLEASDYQTAIERYSQITLRFPFTDYATQAELERLYALHRSFEADRALSDAEKFLREHPRHPQADYVQYLKGLINMGRDESFAGFLGFDTTKEDVSNSRRAFDDLSLLTQKYPASIYNGDARARMIYLRNRIAEHDLHVVRYYMKRGAYLAAAKRGEQVVQQYPSAPATLEALEMMREAYEKLGLKQQAEDVAQLTAAQKAVLPSPAPAQPAAAPAPAPAAQISP